MKKGIEKKENEKKMAVIEADMIFDRERTKIDTEFLPLIEEAVLYKDLYSDEYLKFLSTDAYTKNLQITVGNKIPNTVLGKI